MLYSAMWILATGGQDSGNIPPIDSSSYDLCLVSYHDLFNELLLTLAFMLLFWVFNKALS